MTYAARKAIGACTYDGCRMPAMDDRNECRLHWIGSLDRKRYWWTYRRHLRRHEQLCLVLESG